MLDPAKIFAVKANEFVFLFDESEITSADLVKTSESTFNLIRDLRSVNGQLLDSDIAGKRMTIDIEGETYHVEIKDELDQILEKLGFGAVAGKHIKEIKAPMPGLVLQISVEDGQQVNEGDKILILEAMKMENSILIHTNAVIKKIIVSPGQAVEKGQVLVELE
jgi:biotin carboxyl carrier protein